MLSITRGILPPTFIIVSSMIYPGIFFSFIFQYLLCLYFWIPFHMEAWFRLIKQEVNLSEIRLIKINLKSIDIIHNQCTLKMFFCSINHKRDKTSSSYRFIVKWTEPFYLCIYINNINPFSSKIKVSIWISYSENLIIIVISMYNWCVNISNSFSFSFKKKKK